MSISSRLRNAVLASAVLLVSCGGGKAAAPVQETVPPTIEAALPVYAKSTDITQNLQARIDASNGGIVTIPVGRWELSAPITIRTNNVRIVGEGDFNAGTWLDVRHNGDAFVFDGCQHCGLSQVWIVGYSNSLGFGAVLRNTFRADVSNVRMDGIGNGLHIFGSTESSVRELTMNTLIGKFGILYDGDSQHRSYRATLDNIRGGNSTADIVWVQQDSYAYSLVIDKAALLTGSCGFRQTDSIKDGTSYPMWTFATDLEVDHNRDVGVDLEAGEGFQASVSWFGSTLSGDAVHIGSAYRGDVSISTTRIMGASKNGVYHAGDALDVVLTGNLIGDNGVNGVMLDGEATRVSLTGNRIGDLIGVDGNLQQYGIYRSSLQGEVINSGNLLSGNSIAPTNW